MSQEQKTGVDEEDEADEEDEGDEGDNGDEGYKRELTVYNRETVTLSIDVDEVNQT